MTNAEILQEICRAVIDDENWEYPKEAREMMLWDIHWTLLNL